MPPAFIASKAKYQRLFESLKADILSGRYQPGQKLPSEATLVRRSGASRITVTRAVRELQALALVERVAGSGTYVRDLTCLHRPHLFGLLIPDLGQTEIFEPICRAIANAPKAKQHALLWGHSDEHSSKAKQAWDLCKQYIAKRVSGVFFAPLEFDPNADKINLRILSALKRAHIAVVLLDRQASKKPERHRPDLVGLNNQQAGYVATTYLIEAGCRRIGFLGYRGSALTMNARLAGYREAVADYEIPPAITLKHPGETLNSATVYKGNGGALPDAFVCVNDRVAGELMGACLAAGLRIPEDICVVGIDDVSYANLLPIRLTTVRQPLREIGEAALQLMLDRIRSPQMQSRELLLDGELIIRDSCRSRECD